MVSARVKRTGLLLISPLDPKLQLGFADAACIGTEPVIVTLPRLKITPST